MELSTADGAVKEEVMKEELKNFQDFLELLCVNMGSMFTWEDHPSTIVYSLLFVRARRLMKPSTYDPEESRHISPKSSSTN